MEMREVTLFMPVKGAAKSWGLLFVPLLGLMSACGDPASQESLGSAQIAVVAPPSVSSVSLLFSGAQREVQRCIPVDGQTTELSGLPTGAVTIQASAYNGANCEGTATWLAEPLRVVLVPARLSRVRVVFQPNGLAEVSTEFLADESCGQELTTPALYDNAGGAKDFGQTFIARDEMIGGVQFFIRDPARAADDPRVDELEGPAELVLLDASDLTAPVELARATAAVGGEAIAGAYTFAFPAPVATTPGGRYFIGLSAGDGFGLGLTNQYESTFSDGNEATFDPATNLIAENPLSRDLSFQLVGCGPL
jgi:hypothetical protein